MSGTTQTENDNMERDETMCESAALPSDWLVGGNRDGILGEVDANSCSSYGKYD